MFPKKEVLNQHYTTLQEDRRCNICRCRLPEGTRVLGTIISLDYGRLLSSHFEATCLSCARPN